MSAMGRLLLVDDDADMLRVSSEIFRADGYEVEEASTGA